MALQIFDRIKERIQTGVGTGALTLLGAPTGFKTFSSRLNISDTTYYCVEGPGGVFEIGVGTLTTSTTLARTTILKSSNSDAAISIGDSGQYFVFITLAADKAAYKDGSGRIVSGATGIIFSDNTVQTTAPVSVDLTPYLTSATAAATYAALAGSYSNPTWITSLSWSKISSTPTTLAGYGITDSITSSVATATYVPYTGATGALNLGTYAITCGAITATGIVSASKFASSYDAGGFNAAQFTGPNSTVMYMDQYGQFAWSDSTKSRFGSSGADFHLPSDGAFGISSGNVFGTITNKISRGSAGPTWDLQSNGGTRIRNLANSADAALTCGTITASGDISVGNNTIYVHTSGYFRFADYANMRSGGSWGLVDVAPMDNNQAGTLRLYNNMYSLTNYERLEVGQGVAGDAFIRTAAGGTGTRRGLTLDAAATTFDTANGGGSATYFFRENGISYFQVAGGSSEIQGTTQYAFSATSAPVVDIAIRRVSATQLEINNRTLNTLRDLRLRDLTCSAITASGAVTLSGSTADHFMSVTGTYYNPTLFSSGGGSSNYGNLVIKQSSTSQATYAKILFRTNVGGSTQTVGGIAGSYTLTSGAEMAIGTSSDGVSVTNEAIRITGSGAVHLAGALTVNSTSRFEDYIRGNTAASKLYIADDIALTATKKLYLDGGSNTYLSEVSTDTVSLVCGGAAVITATNSSAGINLNYPVNIPATTYFVGNAAQGYRFNNATNSVNLLVIRDNGFIAIGGTSASYPGYKPSGTTLAFRLGDDSADGPISCGAITASGNLTLTGTGNGIFLNSGGSARGIIYFSTNENRLYSASYPWVVESDQGFKVRNAANNADAALTCGAITASGIIRQSAEITSTPSGTTQTLTLNNGNHQTLTLTSSTGDVTVTLTVPTSSSAGTLIINQHGTTPRDITWAVSSGTIKWMGAEPTWNGDAASAVRIVSWRWNGSVMYLMSTDIGA